MTIRPIDAIGDLADQIRAGAETNEELSRVADPIAKGLRESGVMKLLAPAGYGGLEAHPREFAETVMKAASLDGSTGWVCGIVGVHPWQMAFADPRVQEEVWGEDDNTWIASPYAPTGIARPVDGGYLFNGRWQFSSGTDHCDWIFLGAMLGTPEGEMALPPTMLHMILPRSDYTIVADSWDVVGLKGTGSKDIIVTDAFVPAYRVMNGDHVIDGTAQIEAGMDKTLFKLPWSAMFPLGITSAVIGIAEGALAAHLDYQRNRIGAQGIAIKDDPYNLFALGEAAADIKSARLELLANIDEIWDLVDAGRAVDFERRAQGRQLQIHAAWRAVMAVDQIFARSGGNALRMDKPLQRFWRDAHAGLNHAIHVPSTVWHASALSSMGFEVPPNLASMI